MKSVVLQNYFRMAVQILCLLGAVTADLITVYYHTFLIGTSKF